MTEPPASYPAPDPSQRVEATGGSEASPEDTPPSGPPPFGGPPPGTPAPNPYAGPANPYAGPTNPYGGQANPYWSGPNPYSAPPAPYGGAQPPGYGAYGYQQRRTNGFAIASLVLSCCGIIPFFFGLTAVLGVIFGFIARKQLRDSNGWQQGEGLATAGIIVGLIFVVIAVLVVIVAVTHHTDNCDYNSC